MGCSVKLVLGVCISSSAFSTGLESWANLLPIVIYFESGNSRWTEGPDIWSFISSTYCSGLYWSLIISHQKSPCSFVCTYLFKTLISLSFSGLVFVRFGWMALFWTFSAPKDKSIWKENVPSLHLRRSVNSSSQCHCGCVSQAPVGQKKQTTNTK